MNSKTEFIFNESLNYSIVTNQTNKKIEHNISKFSKENFTEFILVFWILSLLIEEIRQVNILSFIYNYSTIYPKIRNKAD